MQDRDRASPSRTGSPPTIELQTTRSARPWLAALLSLLVPGAGHLYAWRPMMATTVLAFFALAGVALVAALMTATNAITVAVVYGASGMLYIAVAVHAGRLAQLDRPVVRPPAWILAILLVAFVAIAATIGVAEQQWIGRHLARAYRVSSPSMEPGILAGDWLLAAPRRGTLEHDRAVIYRRGGEAYIKRAVGLAGDTLAMRDRHVFRNGQPIPEPYAVYDRSTVAARAATWGPLPVPVGKVFVMGDNRNHASDSRYFGFIDVDSVVGYPARVYFSRDPRTAAIRWGRIGRDLR